MNRIEKAALAALVCSLALISACRSEAPQKSAAELRAHFPALAATILDTSGGRFSSTSGGFIAEPAGPGLRLELPARGADALALTVPGLRATVAEEGLRGPGQPAGRAVAYEREGGHSFWAITPKGYEEWLLLEGGAAKEVRWTVRGARLSTSGGAVVLSGEDGIARVEVTAPHAFAAGGAPLAVRLSVEGQALVLKVPAARGPVLVDPLWAATGNSLSAARYFHTATLLPDERVLVAAGAATSGQLGSAELFDTDAGTWSTTGALAEARQWHAAAPLPGGNVLVTGGFVDGTGAIATAEIWAFDGGSFSATAPLAGARFRHTATALGSDLVLVAGGNDDAGVLSTAELFDPGLGTWTAASPLGTARTGHSATLLGDGRVLMAGGFGAGGAELASAELFDPVGGTFAPTAPMGLPRADHSATLLSTGVVLVVGAAGAAGATAERYDPTAGTWAPVAVPGTAMAGHAAALLGDGKVLVSGGSASVATAEVYDPVANTFKAVGCPSTARVHHTATSLPSTGTVLVTGGLSAGAALSSSELFDPNGGKALGASCGGACECASGFCANSVCCDRACTGGSCEACSVAAGAAADGTCSFFAASAVCRPAAAGGCDVAEQCTGTTGDCPADLVAANTVECRAVAGVCDLPELCNGTTPTCPADGKQPAATLCRAANGGCDVAEQCDGTSAACPADVVAPNTQECRAASGACDQPELCDGTAVSCPADVKRPSTAVCRASGGGCDLEERCDGTTDLCPNDALQPSTFVCRSGAGGCDLAESCTGTSPACPTDTFATQGSAGTPPCGGYVCSGTAASCPGTCTSDTGCAIGYYCGATACTAKKAVGTTCQANNECLNGQCVDGYCCNSPCTDACQSCSLTGTQGTCGTSPAGTQGRPSCAPYLCGGTTAVCPTSCISSAQCKSPAVCDATGVCTGAAQDGGVDGGGDAGQDAGPADAGPADSGIADAGESPDAGGEPRRYVGWGCTSTGPGSLPAAALLLAALALLRRRARPLAAVLAIAVAGGAGSAQAEPDSSPGPALMHLSVVGLRDVQASAVGGEVGASFSLGGLADLGAAASLGKNIGGRLTLALHPPSEGWALRPFLQLRGLYHPTPDGAAIGGGAQVGAQYDLGPGRITAGVMGEVYNGPPGYPALGLFALAGYELDLFKPDPPARKKAAWEDGEPLPPRPPVVTKITVEPPPKPIEPAPVEVVKPPEPVVVVKPPEPVVVPAPVEPPPTPVAGETRVVARIHIRDTITFAPKDGKVRPKFKGVLKKISEMLKVMPQIKTLRVSGHADDTPNDVAEQKLSLKRAEAVTAALVKLGVERKRLMPVGYGKAKLIAPKGSSNRARETNRRVEFLIIDPADMEPDAFREK
ncbi:MAG: kelch repeat-containing protein [Myxococcaceae bacterium]